jgi:myo-inositol 2-dehydrogenase/D-chiro-inositol 1-dehydrogenase
VNKPLGIGLIGCGRAAERYYLPILTRMKEINLVSVADPIQERRELIALKIPGCQVFPSAKSLLKKGNVSAVIIATPPSTHIEIAIQAVHAGVPVLIEKPLAPSMGGVEALKTLVDSVKVPIMVGFNRRFWVPACQLKRIISNLHEPDKIKAQTVMITNIQAWSPVSGITDPLEDLGSHQFDLIRYIFNQEIYAVSAKWIDQNEIRMRIELMNGGIVNCLAAYQNIYKEFYSIQVKNKIYKISTGSERIQPASGLIRSSLDFSDSIFRKLHNRKSSFKNSHQLELTTFLRHVTNGTTPKPSIDDGIEAIRAVEAARQSANMGGKVVLL